jgi:hypothetical protein
MFPRTAKKRKYISKKYFGEKKFNVLTLKLFNKFSVSEAASTNMKACWLFIGEWAFIGIAAPDF